MLSLNILLKENTQTIKVKNKIKGILFPAIIKLVKININVANKASAM